MKNLCYLSVILLVLFSACKKDKKEPQSTSADLLSFSVAGQISSSINKDQRTISVIIPLGAKIDSLVASFTMSEYATVAIGSVSQVSGLTVNNFSSPVTYSVTAQDGVTKLNWTVNVDIEEYSFISEDFPLPGETYYLAVDTTDLAQFAIGAAGESKNWSFAGLGTDVTDTIFFRLPGYYSYGSLFPGASYVYRDNSLSADMFGKLNTEKAEIFGIHAVYGGFPFNLLMNDNSTRMIFPTKLGSNFHDVGSLSKDTTVTIGGFPVAATIEVNVDVTSNVDANGMVTTPAGTFKCVREYNVTITTMEVVTLMGPVPGLGQSDTIRAYNYFNKEKGYPVLSVELNASGNISKIRYLK